MPFENLYRIAFGERKNSNHTERKEDVGVGTDSHIEVAPYDNTKDATETEIRILEERYGELKEGMVLWIDLQTLLEIIPRKRQRTDAYNRLVKALERRGVTLCLTSRKKKSI
jgi:hypothetical protein